MPGPHKAPEGFRCAIIVARWNSHITEPLLDGALRTLRQAGVPDSDIEVVRVPGTVELVYAAARAERAGRFSAIITIGSVIRGDTPHFDYVCGIAAQGTAAINARGLCPVIFGVLTTDNERQALDRAGGPLGNKGAEAAATAIEMALLPF